MYFATQLQNPFEMAASTLLLVLLGWISFVDLKQFRIPNWAVFTLIAAGLVVSTISAGCLPISAVIGAIIGFGLFAILGEVYFRRTGQDGLGLGDAKLLGAAGAWLGWQALPVLVAFAALSALIYAVIMKRTKLAFGPWLSTSLMLLWLVGVRPYY